MAGSSTCKHCGRPIVWAKTARDKNLCVDPNPSTRGAWVIEATGTEAGRVLFVARHARPDDAPDKLRTCHFDTCPQRAGRGR